MADWINGQSTQSGYFALSCTFKGKHRFIYATAVASGLPLFLWLCLVLVRFIQYQRTNMTPSRLYTHCFVAAMAILDLSYIG